VEIRGKFWLVHGFLWRFGGVGGNDAVLAEKQQLALQMHLSRVRASIPEINDTGCISAEGTLSIAVPPW